MAPVPALPPHPLWQILELVSLVISHLDRPDLARMMRVNHTLFNLSGAILWAEVSTVHLGYLIPQKELDRPFSLTPMLFTLRRLALYTPFIRWLCLTSSPLPQRLWNTLLRLLPELPKPVFPNLRTASLEILEVPLASMDDDSAYADAIDLHAELLLALLKQTNTTRVVLSLGASSLTYINYLLLLMQGLAGSNPHLESLQLQRQFPTSATGERIPVRVANDLFRERVVQVLGKGLLSGLSKFEGDVWAFSPEMIIQLGRLERLEMLRVRASLGNPTVGWTAEVAQWLDEIDQSQEAVELSEIGTTFSALRTLELEGPSELLQRVVGLTTTVTDLTLIVRRDELTLLMSIIASQLTQVRRLSLTSPTPRPPADPTGAPLTVQHLLLPLGPCKHLQSLKLDLFWASTSQLRGNTLPLIGDQWPHLRRLTLEGGPLASVPWRLVRPLLETCHELVYLSLPVHFPDAYSPHGHGESPPLSIAYDTGVERRWLEFHPRRMINDSPRQVVRLLWDACPDVRVVDAAGWAWEEVAWNLEKLREDELEERKNAYAEESG